MTSKEGMKETPPRLPSATLTEGIEDNNDATQTWGTGDDEGVTGDAVDNDGTKIPDTGHAHIR